MNKKKKIKTFDVIIIFFNGKDKCICALKSRESWKEGKQIKGNKEINTKIVKKKTKYIPF